MSSARLMSLVICGAIFDAVSFSILDDIPSGPLDFDIFKDFNEYAPIHLLYSVLIFLLQFLDQEVYRLHHSCGDASLYFLVFV